MTTRTATSITVYWDSQDSSNEGWAYRTEDGNGLIESGALDADADDLDAAIEEACSEVGVDLRPDDFAREPHVDGGYAVWSLDE